LFEKGCAWPLGIAWCTITLDEKLNKRRAEIHSIYTIEWARRKGIATKILNEILENCDTLTTTSGSSFGGEKLLKAFGFHHKKKMCQWAYTQGKSKK